MMPNTGLTPSNGRYVKGTSGVSRTGYHPPMYGGHPGDKSREEGK